jgi:hypothetical protein
MAEATLDYLTDPTFHLFASIGTTARNAKELMVRLHDKNDVFLKFDLTRQSIGVIGLACTAGLRCAAPDSREAGGVASWLGFAPNDRRAYRYNQDEAPALNNIDATATKWLGEIQTEAVELLRLIDATDDDPDHERQIERGLGLIGWLADQGAMARGGAPTLPDLQTWLAVETLVCEPAADGVTA